MPLAFFLKSLNISSHMFNFKNQQMALFCYLRLYLGIFKSCFSSSVATDGKDNHGFKLEKIDGMPENHRKSYYG